ncbi:MAG: c-type cytochrome domain-containing protein, partial [Acidobacteriota bacterium]
MCILLAASIGAAAGDPAFFESKIRPVLATRCYGCHSSKMKAPMGELRLDTKAGLQRGGVNGTVVVAGKPAQSRLLQAMTYEDTHLQMPPSGKLPETVIADFRQWIASGADDPRAEDSQPATTAYK